MIKGIHYVSKKRPGKPILWYVYAWRGGPLIHKSEGGGRPKLGPEQIAAYQTVLMEHRRSPSNTFGRLIEDWRASPEWSGLKDSTRAEYNRALDELPEKWRVAPLSVFNHLGMRDKIAAWRDGYKDTPRKADYLVQVLRALLAWGMSRGRLSMNPAEGITTLWKPGKHATVIWEPEEREAMQAASPPIRDAFNLACLTGLRRGDLCSLPWSAVKTHAIVWETEKSDGARTVTIPIIPPLKALLEELRTRRRKEGVKTVLVNSRGKSWTPDGIEASFIKERNKLGLTKRLHDCRGTFVTELCLADLTNERIAGIVGWGETSVEKLRRIYVDQARVVVEIGERLANSGGNRTVNRSE